MMKIHFTFIGLAFLLLAGCTSLSPDHWQLRSPDDKLSVEVSLDEQGQLFYTLKNNNRKVIEKSPLGIVFEEVAFDQGLTLSSYKVLRNQEDRYTLVTGKQKENHARWNEMQLVMENSQGHEVNVNFRLFDTGLAFNYAFDESGNSNYTLKAELTGFQISQGGHGWMHPYDTIAPWAPAYETYYQNKIPVGTQSPWNKNGWAFPMLFHTGEDWALITDSRMDEGYVGMMVDGNPEGGLYTLILPLEEEARGVCPSQPVLTPPFQTPWRVIITGDNLETIVESNLVFDLAKPNVLTDISWIKPGRSSWSWWAESDSPRDFHRLKEYVDFTKEMGWEYFLVDANWNHMEGGTLQELTQYANEQGVGIAAWYNSGGPHNEITEEPRDLMHIRDVRRAEFKKISEWGIKAIKVDFFQSDKPCVLQLYHDILKDAAEFQLLVNVHGSTIPRGWERTYPNLMTMESVRGGETYKFGGDFPEKAPVHNVILPYTRNVIGTMDYTPVTFSNSTYPKLTTHGHELALAVVYESGLQHFADSDKAYLSQPEYVIEYLKDVPVTWDETRYVYGFPGETAVLARREADTWYLSGISGLETSKTIEATLGFLPQGSYTMELIADGASQTEFRFETLQVEAGQTITIDLLPRGGFAAVIRK